MTIDPDHGSTNMVTVLLCVSTACRRYFPSSPILLCLVWKNLSTCEISVPGHHFTIGHRHRLTVLEGKPACHKYPPPDLAASCQGRKSPSLWLQSH